MKKVSMFVNFTSITGEMTLEQIAGEISSGRFRAEVEEIRTLFNAGRTEEAQQHKKLLPAFTPSATFKGGRKEEYLKEYSGIVHLDFDKLPPERVESVFRKVSTLPYTLLCFTSPSGRGIKVFAGVTTGAQYHAQAYAQVKEWYEKVSEEKADPACKDITRLCFMSYDPSVYFNPFHRNFEVKPARILPPIPIAPPPPEIDLAPLLAIRNTLIEQGMMVKEEDIETPDPAAPAQPIAADKETDTLAATHMAFDNCIAQTKLHKTFMNGSRNDFMFTLACCCNRHGIPEQESLPLAIARFALHDFETTEITNCFKSAYKNHAADFGKKMPRLHDANTPGLFCVLPAPEWMERAKMRPVPKMLFSEFWFEGELCILFADTNVGKSILAVQMGNSISRGEPVDAFKLEAGRQKVLYFDFELSDKQFEARYSVNFNDHYAFNPNFFRAEINPEKADYETEKFNNFEEYLHFSLEKAITETQANILIIDNITYLKDETERSKFALPLMKHLQGLKKKHRLSILALAHTPKRDLSKPLTKNDLQGSKMLINFCDSSFAIGESQTDKHIRYLKQIKARNTEMLYDTENVMVCQLTKPRNFLHFEFLNFGTEREHLKEVSDKERTELENSVATLLKTEPTLSAYAIAKRLCGDESKFKSFQVKVLRMIKKIPDTANI